MDKPLKNTFGLDISNSAIAAVELQLNGKQLKVINYGRVELEPGIVEDECVVVNEEAFLQALRTLLEKGAAGPFKSKQAIISISEDKTFTHSLTVDGPKPKHDDILEAAKDFIPIDLSEAVVDYRFLGSEENGEKQTKVNVDFVAVQKNIVESLIEILAKEGLEVMAVDVSKDSLVRSCKNQFQEGEGDHMVLSVRKDKTVLNLSTKKGRAFTAVSEISGDEFIEKVKPVLNVQAASDIRTLMQSFKTHENVTDEHYLAMQQALEKEVGQLAAKAKEIENIASNQESVKVKTICITGGFCHTPGLSEAVQKVFPDSTVMCSFKYIQLDENTELYYSHAIGLALRSILPKAHLEEINLLPFSRKQQIHENNMKPKLVGRMMTATIALGALMLFSGFFLAKSYIDHVSSVKEVQISKDQIENPYLNKVAQATQEKAQLEGQILSILDEAFPVELLIQKLDSLDANGVTMTNLDFTKSTTGEFSVRLRARVQSRAQTERVLASLERDPYFSQVHSPLSNLVGKGERFIQMDLTVDPVAIVDDYNQINGIVHASAEEEVEETEESEIEEVAEAEEVQESNEVTEEGLDQESEVGEGVDNSEVEPMTKPEAEEVESTESENNNS